MVSTFETGVESLDTARDVTVGFKRRGGVAAWSVSERDLPLGRMARVSASVGFLLDSFDVVSSVVSLSWAPPVLTATPAGAAVVCEPVDVEVIDDSGVEDGSDVFAGVEELVDGFWLTDSVEVVSEFDEVDGSAHAIPGLVTRSAPNPSVRARLPIRPAYASQRTRQLYR